MNVLVYFKIQYILQVCVFLFVSVFIRTNSTNKIHQSSLSAQGIPGEGSTLPSPSFQPAARVVNRLGTKWRQIIIILGWPRSAGDQESVEKVGRGGTRMWMWCLQTCNEGLARKNQLNIMRLQYFFLSLGLGDLQLWYRMFMPMYSQLHNMWEENSEYCSLVRGDKLYGCIHPQLALCCSVTLCNYDCPRLSS